jgi:2-polyprenyl-3-methyl-5-hydroxy-6-metoxy-1,4-benzoquinol methylase
MKIFDPIAYKQMVKEHQERDDPLGWFDSIYSDAEGDHNAVFWADLAPSPYLVKWLENNPIKSGTKKAIAIGCGVGDDAEALTAYGYDVTAFDIAPTAIELCKNRYKKTKVHYLVADLFEYQDDWFEGFDLVYECNTIQVLPGKYRKQAMAAMVNLMAKEGTLLVSCRSRKSGEQEDAIPLPLDKEEIDGFIDLELKEESFLAYDDEQDIPIPHFFSIYRKD